MRNAREARRSLDLDYEGDEPFCALHVLLISLAQLLLEDLLFHMDTIAQADQRASHHDQQTQPVLDTPPAKARGMLGPRSPQQATFAPNGPARPVKC